MLKISRESEINLVNVLIDNDIISGKDLINIKKISTESNKSQIDAVFELKLTDENKILDVLVKEQSLEVVDLTKVQVVDEIKTVLPSNYIKMNFVDSFVKNHVVVCVTCPVYPATNENHQSAVLSSSTASPLSHVAWSGHE